MVVCTGFRNPALTAKLASTIDVISGGRFELGIGAGWKEEEWIAYGYGFPPLGDRMAALGDHLEVITRMFRPGRAWFEGEYANVQGAINVPKGLQAPRIPIIVGGNGRQRTAGYAIKYGDELNLVFIDPDEVAIRMAEVRARCEAAGRDPATLRFSLYLKDEQMRPGQARVDVLARLAEIGVDRAVCFPTRWSPTLEAQAAFADDCRAAGLTLDGFRRRLIGTVPRSRARAGRPEALLTNGGSWRGPSRLP